MENNRSNTENNRSDLNSNDARLNEDLRKKNEELDAILPIAEKLDRNLPVTADEKSRFDQVKSTFNTFDSNKSNVDNISREKAWNSDAIASAFNNKDNLDFNQPVTTGTGSNSSLIDDYADVSSELPDYTGGDD